MGSALGGMDNADMAATCWSTRSCPSSPRPTRLDYVDTLREGVHNIFVECGFEHGSRPTLVVADWPSSYETLAPYMRLYTRPDDRTRPGRARRATSACWTCTTAGSGWASKTVDIIDRLFMIEDLLEYPDALALMDPILDAAARGEVKIFSPMDSQVFASKGALAMLSDELTRPLLDPRRTGQPGPDPAVDPDGPPRPGHPGGRPPGRPARLRAQPPGRPGPQADPAARRPGRAARLAPRHHRAELGGAGTGGAGRPVRDPAPDPARCPELLPRPTTATPCRGSWPGACSRVDNGYGGTWARATTVESNIEVINVGTGAYAGSCLHSPTTPD